MIPTYLRGHLLVASPALHDPSFRRTVVLVTAHSHEGAMGLVLTRPTLAEVSEAVPHLEHLVTHGEHVFHGGPVDITTVTALAELDGTAEPALEVFDGIGYLPATLDPDTEAATLRARVFAGYAGWSEGQLEAELAEASWIVEPAQPDDVFAERPDELWSDVLRRKGGEFRMVATMPEDPSLN